MSLINIYFDSREFTTLSQWAFDGFSPISEYRNDLKKFLDISENGKSNFDRIFQKILDLQLPFNESRSLIEQNQQFYDSGRFGDIKIFPTIIFRVESSKVKNDLLSIQGNVFEQTVDINYFISQKLENLYKNPGYIKKSKDPLKGDNKTVFPKLSVWMWCKALNSKELIDITPFIESINLTNSSDGGSFDFVIAPILGDFIDGEWRINKNSIKTHIQKEYVAQSFVNRIQNKEIKTCNYFFHNIISENDLVFIRFEELSDDSDNRQDYKYNVGFDQLPGKIFDMIGFVDENSFNSDAFQVGINITGRDLTKLLIEDGCYFWATEFRLDGTVIYLGDNRSSSRILRRVESSLATMFSLANKSIEYSLKFVINQLSNTGIVPNEIFESYPISERSTKFIFKNDGNNSNPKPSEEESDGIWKIIKVLVDPQIANLRSVDTSVTDEQGSLINYMKKICQEPFVEFKTETIGDQFYIIARRPPFARQPILDAINGINIQTNQENVPGSLQTTTFSSEYESFKQKSPSFVIDIEPVDVINQSLSYETVAYSWFQLRSSALVNGLGEEVALSFLPAIFLPTFAEIYGSRPLQTQTHYSFFSVQDGDGSIKNSDRFYKQYIYDLKWIIDTHCYLPFTRKGMISINEDRRIKKGTFVRNKLTNEIFYVDNVTNSLNVSNESIDRQTNLVVSRGMVEKYISGVLIEDVHPTIPVSYFNLVSTPVEENSLKTNQENTPLRQNLIKNWRENVDIINFFIKRRQFDV